MTYDEAMLLVMVGYPVRRVGWHSPRQVIRYTKKHKYNPMRNGDGSYFPKEVDKVACDWYIGGSGGNGWYYPEMKEEKGYMLYSDEDILKIMINSLKLMEEH